MWEKISVNGGIPINTTVYFNHYSKEKEVEKMSTLNFKQVIDNIKAGETYEPIGAGLNINLIECKDNGQIALKFNKVTEYYQFDGIKFRKKVKPMKFIEALNSNKKFIFKYETLTRNITHVLKCSRLSTNDEDILQVHKSFCNNEYLSMDQLVMLLGYILTPATLKDALLHGDFYTE